MTEQLQYLRRSLQQRLADFAKSYAHTLEVIMRQNAARGMLASGGTLQAFTDEAVGNFVKALSEGIRFSFSLTERNDAEVMAILSGFADDITAIIVQETTER